MGMGKSRRSARVASTPLFRSASTVSRASLRFTESRRALPARTRILGGCVACMIYLAFKIYDVERLLSDAKGPRAALFPSSLRAASRRFPGRPPGDPVPHRCRDGSYRQESVNGRRPGRTDYG